MFSSLAPTGAGRHWIAIAAVFVGACADQSAAAGAGGSAPTGAAPSPGAVDAADAPAAGGSSPAGGNGAGGGPAGPTPAAVVPAHIVLPEFPFWESNPGLVKDLQVLEEQGGRWCQQEPADASAADFFYGWMPLDTVDRLCEPRAADWPSLETLLGNMYISGYFGGIWFRDNAQSGGGLQRPGGTGQGTSEQGFQDIAQQARELIDVSVAGSDEEVMAHNQSAVDPAPLTGIDLADPLGDLILIYAYNKGYAQSVLDNAPAQIQQLPPFECAEFFDCRAEGVGLDVFERFRFGLEKLRQAETCQALVQPDYAKAECRWGRMAEREADGKNNEAIGASFWQGGDFSPETYETLLTINAGYLLVAGAGAVASMVGYADQDAESGRCGVLLEAAALMWNQGYFQGLNAEGAGERELGDGGVAQVGPQIACPDPGVAP